MLVPEEPLVNTAPAAFLRVGASPSIPHLIAERGGGSTFGLRSPHALRNTV
jgi:hypothetical protein